MHSKNSPSESPHRGGPGTAPSSARTVPSIAAPPGRVLGRIATVLALLVVPGVALAATVKGKVAGGAKLMNPVWNEAKDPNARRYTFREPSATVRPDVRTLTGYLPKELCVVVLGEKGAPSKNPMRMVIAGGRTSPVTLVVAEGQSVQFENLDPFPHKLFDTGGKGLQATEQPSTKQRTWTPPAPGKYEIRDQLSPSIRSWIVVEPRTVAVGYPDRKGEFTIDVEPGQYKLRGYFNGEPVGTEMDLTVKPVPAEQQLTSPLAVGPAGAPADPATTADAGAGAAAADGG
jgi:hypothetical protein